MRSCFRVSPVYGCLRSLESAPAPAAEVSSPSQDEEAWKAAVEEAFQMDVPEPEPAKVEAKGKKSRSRRKPKKQAPEPAHRPAQSMHNSILFCYGARVERMWVCAAQQYSAGAVG